MKLEKSYVRNYSTELPIQEDLVLYQTFQQARDEGYVGEIINLETGENVTTLQIMDKVSHWTQWIQ